jgi:hypothetical protein
VPGGTSVLPYFTFKFVPGSLGGDALESPLVCADVGLIAARSPITLAPSRRYAGQGR